jgi:hypothetical protein
LKGHGFIRANKAFEMGPALAAEGSFKCQQEFFRSLFNP